MNSTETKTELPRDWQIFREANSGGQWSEWRLNTSGKNLPAHDYRECAHVRRVDPLVDSIRELHEQLTKQNNTLRTRLEATEKELASERDLFIRAHNRSERFEAELSKVMETNRELVEALKLWREIISETDHGRQKYGSGSNDIAHDDAHGQQDWTGYILDKGILSRHESGRDHRQLMVQIAGLAISAIQSFDRKEKEFWPNAVSTAEAPKGEG